MVDTDKYHRRYVCELEFMYFAAYYFSEYFNFKIPEFHLKAYEDLEFKDFKYLVWIWFREAAKTSIAKMYWVYLICHKKKHYMLYDSYDLGNSESALYDIALILQTNRKIIADYGQLFYENKGVDKFTQKKSIGSFITTNKIKCEAFSTQEPVRGKVYKQYRPDFVILDDFENVKTKDSAAITAKIIQHIDEMKAGLADSANVLYLANYISEYGSVQSLIDSAKSDPLLRIHRVDVVQNGKVAWPDKYVLTDSEAAKLNAELPQEKKKISLETKKRTLNAKGAGVYEQEMLNIPLVFGDRIFDANKIDKLKEKACEPMDTISDWKFWDVYRPSDRYAIGADTSAGTGKDACAAALINFSSKPAQVVATYKNNTIAPNLFAYELKNIGSKFGECLIAPELNNTGYATVTQLALIYNNIYTRVDKLSILGEQPKKQLGWYTNSANKPEILYQLKTAVEGGELDIPDEELLLELRAYGRSNLNEIDKSKMTRHFDLLIALAIAWEMRNYASAQEYKVIEEQKEDFDPHAMF